MKIIWIMVCMLVTVFSTSAALITANLGTAEDTTDQLVVTKDAGLDNAVFTDITLATGVIRDLRTGASTAFENTFTVTCDGSRSYRGFFVGATDLQGQIDGGRYLTFALTLDSAEVASLDGITIRGLAAAAATTDWALFISTDGFASAPNVADAIFGTLPIFSSGTTTNAADPLEGYADVDFSPSSSLVLSGDTTYTFRLYINESPINDIRAMSLDNIVFDVTTVIPEPATIGMVGIGSLLVLLVRRYYTRR